MIDESMLAIGNWLHAGIRFKGQRAFSSLSVPGSGISGKPISKPGLADFCCCFSSLPLLLALILRQTKDGNRNDHTSTDATKKIVAASSKGYKARTTLIIRRRF